MEAKIRIVEISPKIKLLKTNPKDIISISFFYDNCLQKIGDVEKSIKNNDKITISLNESKESKNKIQPIKYTVIRNENNIIGTGEFIPIEGIKWYKLNEIYNNISKESLITSSTSNGNIKINNRKSHNLSDYRNSHGNEQINNNYTKNNSNHLYSPVTTIKIKFAINILNKKLNKKNINHNNHNNHYNTIINNNYTNEPSENSKYEEFLFDKNKDIFKEEDFTLLDSENSKLNQKAPKTTKKANNQKLTYNKKFSKKKSVNYTNQCLVTSENKPDGDSIVSTKIIGNTLINSKPLSPKRKTNVLPGKKLLNEEMRMKTSINFNLRKSMEIKEVASEKKYANNRNMNNNEIKRKLKSCENIEDEILDQNFKNYLKNDEILKANLSRNNSLNNLIQNNNNDIKDTNRCQKTCCSNFNSSLSQSTRCNIIDNFETYNKKNSKKINKTIITQELNDNHLYNSSLQLFRNNDEYNSFLTEILPNNNFKRIKTNKNFDENITLMNTDENFERLKIDFLLLYSNENIKKINNDDLFLELQLMIEKILTLQDKHQKEYIGLFNSININKNVSQNYENKYISLIKKINKLNAKKIFIDIKDKRKELYNENKINFINTRSKIMNKGEFIIWRKMMEKSSKSKIGNNNKNKITNIFLTICRKHENILNKLSFKFYKEIKNKQIKKNANNSSKKINKFYSNTFFSERKGLNKNMRISETESNMQYLNTNMQNIKKLNSNSKIKKYSKISKKNTKIDVKDISNSNNNNINFGTMVYESSTNKIYCNTKKINKCKKKSSSISDKSLHKKKGANKSQ